MKIYEILEYIKATITNASPTMTNTISDIEISPARVDEYLYNKRNFPCLNIWENGYECLYEKTTLQGKMRRWKINLALFVRNQMDELMDAAYKELIELEDEISALINDLSGTDGKLGATQEMVLRGQSSEGAPPIQVEETNYYLLMRVTEYIIETVEIT